MNEAPFEMQIAIFTRDHFQKCDYQTAEESDRKEDESNRQLTCNRRSEQPDSQ